MSAPSVHPAPIQRGILVDSHPSMPDTLAPRRSNYPLTDSYRIQAGYPLSPAWGDTMAQLRQLIRGRTKGTRRRSGAPNRQRVPMGSLNRGLSVMDPLSGQWPIVRSPSDMTCARPHVSAVELPASQHTDGVSEAEPRPEPLTRREVSSPPTASTASAAESRSVRWWLTSIRSTSRRTRAGASSGLEYPTGAERQGDDTPHDGAADAVSGVGVDPPVHGPG